MAEGCCCIAEKLCHNLKKAVAYGVLSLMADFLLLNSDVLWLIDDVL